MNNLRQSASANRKPGFEMNIPATHARDRISLDEATPVLLDYSWPPGIPHAKTEVRIAWSAGELLVRGDMEDEEVTTRATADSQHFWELGDVFEIFLEAQDAGFYTEMHVAPGNHRLHLHIGHDDCKAMKIHALTPSDLAIRPPGFASRSAATSTGWTAEARIPARLVDPKGLITKSSQWRASFCRYDAWSDGRPPVLSSTSPHKELNFHRRHEWRPICF